MAALITAFLIAKASQKVNLPGTERERNLCNMLLLAGVSLWVGINIFFTAEQVFINRDPAVYNNTAAWLVNNEDLHIKKSDAFGAVPGVQANSAGFGLSLGNKNELFAQGVHLLPALMGLGGRVIGLGPMLHLNVLLGGVALLAIYGFARMLTKPRWALVAATVISISLPFLYFSRGTYTEPLALALAFSALSTLWLAQKSERYELWFLTGLILGAGTFTRIDAYLTIAAFEAFLVIKLALARKSERSRAIKQAGLLAVGTVLSTTIGWLDLTQLSSGYYQSQKAEITPELLLIVGTAIVGFFATSLAWSTQIISKLNALTRSWRSRLGAGLIIVGALILASRPLWYQGNIPELQGIRWITIRSYTERSLEWVTWYLGPLAVIVGIGGLTLVVYRALQRRDLLLVAPTLVVLGTSLLYFIKPSIHPDQIWASRRFLPIIMPGLTVFAAVALEKMYRLKIRRPAGLNSKVITSSVVTLMLIGPLFITYPFLFTRSYAPEFSQVQIVCKNLPERSAVLWLGDSSLRGVQPTRSFCGVPSMGYGRQIYQSILARAAKNAHTKGYIPIVGIFGDQLYAVSNLNIGTLSNISEIKYSDLEQGRRGPPRNLVTPTRAVYMGIINPDGTVSPLMGQL